MAERIAWAAMGLLGITVTYALMVWFGPWVLFPIGAIALYSGYNYYFVELPNQKRLETEERIEELELELGIREPEALEAPEAEEEELSPIEKEFEDFKKVKLWTKPGTVEAGWEAYFRGLHAAELREAHELRQHNRWLRENVTRKQDEA